jgi:hypothetical protein
MRSDAEVQLISSFPEIFSSDFFLECDSGWYPLIRGLCAQMVAPVRSLQYKVAYHAEMLAVTDRASWSSWQINHFTDQTLENLRLELEVALAETPRAEQVKEKFGTLRFYVSGATPEQHAQIALTEHLSASICEQCGSWTGTLTYWLDWHKTLCPLHADQRYGAQAAAWRNKLTGGES